MEIVLEKMALALPLVERGVQLIKTLIPYDSIEPVKKYGKYIDQAFVTVLAVGLCYIWRLDFFAPLGLVFPLPWLGMAMTGAVLVVPSNIVHDFIELVRAVQQGKAAQLRGIK